MSRVLEAEGYADNPGMEFAINPSQELFVKVRSMARIKSSNPEDESPPMIRERPFTGGLLRRIGARIWLENNARQKEPVCYAGMAFWFKENPFVLDIAREGRKVCEYLEANGFSTDYYEDPLDVVNIGIGTNMGGRIALLIPPARLGVSVTSLVNLPFDTYMKFFNTLYSLNIVTSLSIDSIHRFLGQMPGRVKYTFNLHRTSK